MGRGSDQQRRGLRRGAGPGPLRRPDLVVVLLLAAVAGLVGGVHDSFKDLVVYQYAGQAVLDGVSVYASDEPVHDLPFTYPPFAAIVFVPLALLPSWLASALWTGASIGALAAVVVVTLRALDRPAPGWLVAVLVAGALAMEPVWQNLTFGQVNLVLMLVVIVDLVHPRRGSGVLVGLAAGLKLTPLVFVVLLLLVGRRVDAARAGVVFVGTVVVGLALPGGAAYWTEDLLDADRVGPPALAHNQSVYGALARLLDGSPPLWLWLVVAGPLALAVLVVATVGWRRGDRVLGTCLAALAMLVASPVSWSHHWVWAVPVALVLWQRSRLVALLWTTVFVARPMLWPPWGADREYEWGPVEHLVGNAYLLAAVAVAAWAARLRPAGPRVRHTGP